MHLQHCFLGNNGFWVKFVARSLCFTLYKLIISPICVCNFVPKTKAQGLKTRNQKVTADFTSILYIQTIIIGTVDTFGVCLI